MGIFDKFKKTTIKQRRYEEKLYEIALEEVEAGDRRKGLYSKALSKADGDTEKADGIYLKLRVQSIMDDDESEQINQRATQALESEKASFKSRFHKDSLAYECDEMLANKGYKLEKPIFGDYWICEKDNIHASVYSSKDLSDIKQWASSAKKVSTWE
jgi:hypothetical protein